MFGQALRALRSAVRRSRRVLLAVWVEARRSAAASGDNSSPTAVAALERTRTGKYRSGILAIEPRGDHRRSYSAIATDSPGTGIVAARDYSQLTLSAIHRAMLKLETQGYKPDGIILRVDEARIMLKQNFDWEEGDPLPENIQLFGLPVKVQE